ncbi:type II toxin-antitoxin system CcdA family antitoxin [Hyperthermus butylicus]|uniref:Conserved archaeal protein n=1 Tax=Hyperthermus butylicus (strain DSM 5456 / JCM 9403 / PLM1-5) TaxID=415426 RepID=A2BMW2_HYPBU|nr:type II toxin-antitoxin system CcdA family antitoxin [Hyperthermus butylicus]ABM81323.1 conserved archaeal protein [Hyperthermus butylicus DSM 5456]
MGSVVVSARISRELYEKAKRYGINISEVVRKALEEEVKRREDAELRRLLGEARRILEGIPPEEIVRLVRESREER